MSLEQVVLVDEADKQTGLQEKIAAHQAGALHRAISVLIHDRHGRWLIQRRAMEKYHSGRLWTNACCSHPRAGEVPEAAARRRLSEELGFTADVTFIGTVRYRSALDRGMIENELVHVFTGRWDGPVRPDPDEVEGYDWLFEHELGADIKTHPERYTVWFKKYLDELGEKLGAVA